MDEAVVARRRRVLVPPVTADEAVVGVCQPRDRARRRTSRARSRRCRSASSRPPRGGASKPCRPSSAGHGAADLGEAPSLPVPERHRRRRRGGRRRLDDDELRGARGAGQAVGEVGAARRRGPAGGGGADRGPPLLRRRAPPTRRGREPLPRGRFRRRASPWCRGGPGGLSHRSMRSVGSRASPSSVRPNTSRPRRRLRRASPPGQPCRAGRRLCRGTAPRRWA